MGWSVGRILKILKTVQSPKSPFPFLFDFGLAWLGLAWLGLRTWDLGLGLELVNILIPKCRNPSNVVRSYQITKKLVTLDVTKYLEKFSKTTALFFRTKVLLS